MMLADALIFNDLPRAKQRQILECFALGEVGYPTWSPMLYLGDLVFMLMHLDRVHIRHRDGTTPDGTLIAIDSLPLDMKPHLICASLTGGGNRMLYHLREVTR